MLTCQTRARVTDYTKGSNQYMTQVRMLRARIDLNLAKDVPLSMPTRLVTGEAQLPKAQETDIFVTTYTSLV